MDSSVAAVLAVSTLEVIAHYESERTAVVQSYLSQQSELTEAVLEEAHNYANGLVDHPWDGYATGISAGFFGGFALYHASKKEK